MSPVVEIPIKLSLSNKFITIVYSELLKLLKKNGWFEVRQKSSHIILRHPIKLERLTVPNHSSKEVKKGLLKAILKQANVKTDKR